MYSLVSSWNRMMLFPCMYAVGWRNVRPTCFQMYLKRTFADLCRRPVFCVNLQGFCKNPAAMETPNIRFRSYILYRPLIVEFHVCASSLGVLFQDRQEHTFAKPSRAPTALHDQYIFPANKFWDAPAPTLAGNFVGAGRVGWSWPPRRSSCLSWLEPRRFSSGQTGQSHAKLSSANRL